MSLGTVALATLVAGGTFAYAKSKNASNGQAAAVGAAAGAGTAVTAFLVAFLISLLPILAVAAIVGVPAAGAYYYLNKGKARKALGPGKDL